YLVTIWNLTTGKAELKLGNVKHLFWDDAREVLVCSSRYDGGWHGDKINGDVIYEIDCNTLNTRVSDKQHVSTHHHFINHYGLEVIPQKSYRFSLRQYSAPSSWRDLKTF